MVGGAVLVLVVCLVLLRKTPKTRTHLVRHRVLQVLTTLAGTVIALGIALVLYIVIGLDSFMSGP